MLFLGDRLRDNFKIIPLVGKSLSSERDNICHAAVGFYVSYDRIEKRGDLTDAYSLCFFNKRIDELSLSSCTADIGVGITMSDSYEAESLLAVKNNSLARGAVILDLSSDGGGFICFYIKLYTAEGINDGAERIEVYGNIIVDSYLEIIFNSFNKLFCTAVGIAGIDLCILSA